jgi:sortase A
MKARLTWHGDEMPNPRRRPEERSALRGLEWVLLIVGLLAVDCFVWVNTSSVLYQAYEDWAFDQSLRGLTPGMGGFLKDEAGWMFRGGRDKAVKVDAPTPELKTAPSEAHSGPPAAKSVIGRLEIPRIGVAVMVREGADEGTLSRAVGHIPGTALPGAIGNVGLAGHRDTFFRALRNIRADDTISLETTDGTYQYVVKSTKIVTPRDVSVLEASGGETLTLVTCYPFYYVGSAPKRFIVHASQVQVNSRRQQPHSPQQGS